MKLVKKKITPQNPKALYFMERKNENMSKAKEKNGITLISLVITIIILLILSGISISMLTRREWNIN